MNYQRTYKGTIWTNHALQRLEQRGIRQGDAWATWSKPDSSKYSKSRGGWVYTRTWRTERIEVVAKQNDKKEWIILSVWGKTVHTKSTKPTQHKSNFWHQFSHLFTNPVRKYYK